MFQGLLEGVERGPEGIRWRFYGLKLDVLAAVEEEKSATEVAERLRMAGEDSAALLLLDSELGSR